MTHEKCRLPVFNGKEKRMIGSKEFLSAINGVTDDNGFRGYSKNTK